MITGVVLARNEEDNIVQCVEALRPHVSEIILIDMESEDRTVELAKPLVEKTIPHPKIPNFDSARNAVVSTANNEWLWFVDADERVPNTTGELVKELIHSQGSSFEAINIPFKTYFCGKWIQHSGWWPGYTTPRVLKRGFFRFSDRLHGGVELSGREVRIAADPSTAVDHFSYLSIEHYIEKFNRYTSTEAMQLKDGGQSIDWRNAIAHMTRDLWLYYEHNDGKLDGRHGWLLAWLSGQYRWLSHAKLLDLDQTVNEKGAEEFPESLDDVISVMQQELEMLRHERPVLPLGVVWRSPIWDLSGYADEGRCITKALSRCNRSVVLEPIIWGHHKCEIRDEDKSLFQTMQRTVRQRSNIAITNSIPSMAVPDRAAAVNVIRTTFETDRIPKQWHSHLEVFDEIWVISKLNETAFVRSGVAPEKIRRIPSFLDTDLYRPDGDQLQLSPQLDDRFIFLSVLDWQLRKGWDLLLEAYCKTFSKTDGVGLLVKVSRFNNVSSKDVWEQANSVLKLLDQDLDQRTDIQIVEEFYTAKQMSCLYRSVDAFVLPSRGEGWGRPYMEAMASGLPTIGTAGSGNSDFMSDDNSVLIPANLVEVPKNAAEEINVFQGSNWFEPDLGMLCDAMKSVVADSHQRHRISRNAIEHIRSNHSLNNGTSLFADAIDNIEEQLAPARPEVGASGKQIPVVWEGEFFAGHSFSNINEQLAPLFAVDNDFDFSISRRVHNPTHDLKAARFANLSYCFDRAVDPQFTIRHCYPPNWNRPKSGRWIHIQPWEYGHLPSEWILPLKEGVDEIWVPSNYVKQVYVNSGIPESKIHVIHWGVDTNIFNPDVPQRFLPTSKTFKFLFVGGTIRRKGFDRLFRAYCNEFSSSDDVCLVVKDLGADSFYRFGTQRDEVIRASEDPSLPDIVYFDERWTAGQIASLYTACDCLVMPYRGEGFGLPILEAMACGVPPIVPRGGASDDFVNDDVGILIDSRLVEANSEMDLVGPALELELSPHELQRAMRAAFENANTIANLGDKATEFAAKNFSWEQTYKRMRQRIFELTSENGPDNGRHRLKRMTKGLVTACVHTCNDEKVIASCLSRLKPHVDEIVVIDRGSNDRTSIVAEEYGLQVVENPGPSIDSQVEFVKSHVNTKWFFQVSVNDVLPDDAISRIDNFLESQLEMTAEVAMYATPERSASEEPSSQLPYIRFIRADKEQEFSS